MKQFWFIGVSTGQSMIMRLFPVWAKLLGLQDTRMYGVDLPPGVSGEKVRESVLRLRDAPNALGALVTTHKLAVWKEAADLFSEVDEHASRLQEISCISRNKDGQLIGHAKDFITSAKALNLLLPQDHWQNHPEAETLVMGCGGAGTAIIEQLTLGQNGTFPKRVTGLEFNTHRLETVCKQFGSRKNLILDPADKEGITAVKKITALPPHSLVINATGMGKDLPGSPVQNGVVFPQQGFVWELNYRGSLEFFHQARVQQESKQLTVHNGWNYFLLGWASVMEEVFHLELTDELMGRMKEAAKPLRSS